MLSYYSHRGLGEETQPVVDTGIGSVYKLDEAHALSYLMAGWDVLITEKVTMPSAPSGQDIYITSVCGDKGCQRCGTAHTVQPGQAGEIRLAFIYCLCDRAEMPRLDKEYAT